MPQYMYRREDGSTFTIRQKFSDDALTVDPDTGQKVVRVVQPTGIIFKGSGFYVNDSKGASKSNLSKPAGNGADSASDSAGTDSTEKTGADKETKSETKAEKKTGTTKSDAAD